MLTSKRVNEIFLDCLFKDHELGPDGQPPEEKMVKAQGITILAGFSREQIGKYASEIATLCDELPDTFKEGMSFLAMCYDRHENQWGEHNNMQELMLLGCASGKMKMPLPKDMWPVLPGGMPYIQVMP